MSSSARNGSGPPTTRPFTTDAQAEFRRRSAHRLAAAAVVAVFILLLMVWLGPDERSVRERFEYYGAPGEMRIMPEISIDQGSDAVHQLPKSLQAPPPPADVEILRERPDPRAADAVPPPREQERDRSELNANSRVPDAQEAAREQAELLLPQQTSTDWYILNLVRPEYPLTATESDRRQRYLYVWLQVFVGPDGLVSDVLVQSNDGSPVFAEVAVAAVRQWRVGWRTDPGAGRWLRFPWRFKSPYVTSVESR